MKAFRKLVGGGGKKKKEDNKPKGKSEKTEEKNEEAALREAFQRFDTNGDGYIDKEELSVLLTQFLDLKKKPSDAQIARIMVKVDLNNDGKISFEEFKAMMAGRDDTKNEYLKTFKNFDKDGDGFITIEELGECMKKVHPDTTDEEINLIMESLDENNDGKISFQEFLNYFVG